MKVRYLFFVYVFSITCLIQAPAQDTLTVMVQNVLHYGDGCQGSNSYLHSKLEKEVWLTRPDVLGLVKAQAIRINDSDFNGISPIGFADSIIIRALDPATAPGTYAYCTLTAVSRDADGDMDILFYNQNKLGFVSVTNLCSVEEDFDLYKLYYKDTNLSKTHDTTFIYFVLNHTDSGTLSIRDNQDSTVIAGLKKNFYHLPNLISMGDFNTSTSSEPGYMDYALVSDTSFMFDDAPFYPDAKFTYPLNWHKNVSCSAYLNTSTRVTTSPNSCGASGGAKDWIEHMFLSKWLINNTDYIQYIKNSYTTVGNDGKHFEASINDSTSYPKNTSAPSSIINSIYELSDKYPVLAKFAVTFNTTGTGPINPVNSVNEITSSLKDVYIVNPIHNSIYIHYPAYLAGKKATICLYDLFGRLVYSASYQISDNTVNTPVNLSSGLYFMYIETSGCSIIFKLINE